MKKYVKILSALVLALTLFTGCDNFLSGVNLKEELSAMITDINAQTVSVTVYADSKEGLINPSGSVSFKLEIESKNLVFSEDDAYSFQHWEVRTGLDKDAAVLEEGKDYKIEDANSPSTKITILKYTEGMVIVPVCIERISEKNEPSPAMSKEGVSRDRSIKVKFTKAPDKSCFVFKEYEIPEGADKRTNADGEIVSYTINGITYFKNVTVADSDGVSLNEYFNAPEIDEDDPTMVMLTSASLIPVTESRVIEVTFSGTICGTDKVPMKKELNWKYKVTESTDDKAKVSVVSQKVDGVPVCVVQEINKEDISIDASIELSCEEIKGYQFIKWECDKPELVEIKDPLNPLTKATVMEKTAADEFVTITAKCAPRLTVTGSPKTEGSETISKNSAVSLTFSQELVFKSEEEKKAQLDTISILTGGNSIISCFLSPVLSDSKTIVTFAADNSSMIEVEGSSRTITVTVPADFYYYLADGTKVTVGGNGYSFDYKINNTTVEKTVMTFSNTVNAGTVTATPSAAERKDGYSINESIQLKFEMSDDYIFNGWSIKSGGKDVPKDEISISSSTSLTPVITVYKVLPNVIVTANCSEKLKISEFTPTGSYSTPSQKDADIVIKFNHPLAEECNLSNIHVTLDGSDVDSSYAERTMEGDTITIKNTAAFAFEKNEVKAVSVTVPKEFYYVDGKTKIHFEEDVTKTFSINDVSKDRLSIKFITPEAVTGNLYFKNELQPSGDTIINTFNKTDDYQDISFVNNSDYCFVRWNVQGFDETKYKIVENKYHETDIVIWNTFRYKELFIVDKNASESEIFSEIGEEHKAVVSDYSKVYLHIKDVLSSSVKVKIFSLVENLTLVPEVHRDMEIKDVILYKEDEKTVVPIKEFNQNAMPGDEDYWEDKDFNDVRVGNTVKIHASLFNAKTFNDVNNYFDLYTLHIMETKVCDLNGSGFYGDEENEGVFTAESLPEEYYIYPDKRFYHVSDGKFEDPVEYTLQCSDGIIELRVCFEDREGNSSDYKRFTVVKTTEIDTPNIDFAVINEDGNDLLSANFKSGSNPVWLTIPSAVEGGADRVFRDEISDLDYSYEAVGTSFRNSYYKITSDEQKHNNVLFRINPATDFTTTKDVLFYSVKELPFNITVKYPGGAERTVTRSIRLSTVKISGSKINGNNVDVYFNGITAARTTASKIIYKVTSCQNESIYWTSEEPCVQIPFDSIPDDEGLEIYGNVMFVYANGDTSTSAKTDNEIVTKTSSDSKVASTVLEEGLEIDDISIINNTGECLVSFNCPYYKDESHSILNFNENYSYYIFDTSDPNNTRKHPLIISKFEYKTVYNTSTLKNENKKHRVYFEPLVFKSGENYGTSAIVDRTVDATSSLQIGVVYNGRLTMYFTGFKKVYVGLDLTDPKYDTIPPKFNVPETYITDNNLKGRCKLSYDGKYAMILGLTDNDTLPKEMDAVYYWEYNAPIGTGFRPDTWKTEDQILERTPYACKVYKHDSSEVNGSIYCDVEPWVRATWTSSTEPRLDYFAVELKDIPDESSLWFGLTLYDAHGNSVTGGANWLRSYTCPYYPEITYDSTTGKYTSKITKPNIVDYHWDIYPVEDQQNIAYYYDSDDHLWRFSSKFSANTEKEISSNDMYRLNIKAYKYPMDDVPTVFEGLTDDYYSYYRYFVPSQLAEGECSLKDMIPGSNGYNVFCDKPCIIHTVCSEFERDNIGEWERYGGIRNEVYTESSMTYKVNVDEIPKYNYYVVIAHFADGTSLISDVKRKQ